MDLPINFYDKESPEKGDIITIYINKCDKDIVHANIFEYPKFTGIIQISDLSHKKTKSVKSFVTNKPTQAEVIDVSKDTKIINLTKKYLSKEDDIKFGRYYKDQIRLIKIIKNIAKEYKLELKDCIKNILYPINKHFSDITCPQIIDYISNNYKNKDFIDFGDYNHILMKEFNELFKPKPTKFTTEFSLIASKTVNDYKRFFEYLENKYPQITFKSITAPKFIIESIGIDETKLHNEILQFIEKNSKNFNIVFKS